MRYIRATTKSLCKEWIVNQVRLTPGITFLELALNPANPSKAKDKKTATDKAIGLAIADGLIKTSPKGGYEAL